ncbi:MULTISPECIES: nuclear transport factor 2 family protein [unclassified Janthinobacterium]|uniref:nuclear transport factor 2 family protein n=1 Tax=unclassified Janthinobacterium TaxID=2610881 RepID=UPI0025AF2B28|nr:MULTISPECIES: nuclear transport factor 2 family protein [unclassified Janthinobacterium]MDN2700838.1 nuclear transport factor 2 family protein [Janthinobacterium sp. SUN100]MDO8039904.1 nuclear transport factor 2 family protein [Janthinobacterium sp. SUN137]
MQEQHPGSEAAMQDQLRDIERGRLRALVDGDVALARTLHADDFQLVTPIGSLLSREEYLGAIAAGHMRYLSWEPGEIAVRVHGDAAVLRYQAQLEIHFAGQAVPRARYWHIDSYERRAGRWQAVWSQATAIR